MLYRICTENIPAKRTKVERAVANDFPGFTIIEGAGYWNGTREDSLIIEILTLDSEGGTKELDKIRAVARLIKRILKQEAVLIQVIAADTHFV